MLLRETHSCVKQSLSMVVRQEGTCDWLRGGWCNSVKVLNYVAENTAQISLLMKSLGLNTIVKVNSDQWKIRSSIRS